MVWLGTPRFRRVQRLTPRFNQTRSLCIDIGLSKVGIKLNLTALTLIACLSIAIDKT